MQTARIYRGVGILEYMDIEYTVCGLCQKNHGVMNYYLGKGIFLEDNKGMFP